MRKLLLLAIILIICSGQVSAQTNLANLGKALKGTIAVQLWSFREAFKADVPGTLKRVHDLPIQQT